METTHPTRSHVVNHLRGQAPVDTISVGQDDDCHVCGDPATVGAWRICSRNVIGLPDAVYLCSDPECAEDLAWWNERQLGRVWAHREAEIARELAALRDERAARLRAAWAPWAQSVDAAVGR